jgi:hypothetical protein
MQDSKSLYENCTQVSVGDVILHTPIEFPSRKCRLRTEDKLLHLSQFIINLYRQLDAVSRLSELHRIEE